MGVFYVDWTVRARKSRKSLKTSNRKEARVALKRLIRGETNPKIPWGDRPTPKCLGVSLHSRPSLQTALDDFVQNTSFPSPDTVGKLGTCRSIFDRLCSDWENFRRVQVWRV
jgi:hypothetical protein